jgi:Flp pilus assembly protein CpaB
MSAVVVALMVLMVLLVGLLAVLAISKGLKKEVDKVHAARRTQTAGRKD